MYPTSYHKACAHLVAFGGHLNSATGRCLIAVALRELRRTRRDANECRRGMKYIAGHFPVKVAK